MVADPAPVALSTLNHSNAMVVEPGSFDVQNVLSVPSSPTTKRVLLRDLRVERAERTYDKSDE